MSQAQIVTELGQAYAAGALGFRNKIINGNFRIWQRGAGPFNAASFNADRWGVDAQGSPTVAVVPGTINPGDDSIFPAPAKNYLNINVSNSGDPATGVVVLRTRIEGVGSMRGKVTASLWLIADTAGKKVSVAMVQIFGSGGSPSAGVFTPPQLLTLTAGWQRYVVTFDLPSISGKTLGTNGDDCLEFRIVPTSGTNNSATTGMTAQTINMNVAQVQVEPGPIATPYEDRPIGLELALCQRYYMRWNGTGGFRYCMAYAFSTTQAEGMIPTPTMRAIPTCNYSAASDFSLQNAVATALGVTAINAYPNAGYILFRATTSGGLVAGNASEIIANGAIGWLDASAEL